MSLRLKPHSKFHPQSDCWHSLFFMSLGTHTDTHTHTHTDTHTLIYCNLHSQKLTIEIRTGHSIRMP